MAIPADPNKFEEAVRAIKKRVPMGEAEFDALAAGAKEHAFKVAGVAQADMAQDVLDALTRAVEDGTTLDTFKKNVGAKLERAWGGAKPARLETIFRANVQKAYSAGREAIMSAPAVRRARPFSEYRTVGDGNVSEGCEKLDGTVLPSDDPRWKKITPPRFPGCRCEKAPLTEEEALALGVSKTVADVEPAEGFGSVPSEDGKDWEPDPSDYDGPMAKQVRKL